MKQARPKSMVSLPQIENINEIPNLSALSVCEPMAVALQQRFDWKQNLSAKE